MFKNSKTKMCYVKKFKKKEKLNHTPLVAHHPKNTCRIKDLHKWANKTS